MPLKLKVGVDFANVAAPIWWALGQAKVVFELNGKDLIVTSLRDGVHSKGSLHYKGLAADIRTRHLERGQAHSLTAELYEILNPAGFDVVLEKDHIHIEYDPKGSESWFVYA